MILIKLFSSMNINQSNITVKYILAVGDIHFKRDNSAATLEFANKLYEYIESNINDISSIVLLGDICHYFEKLYTQCMIRVINFFSKLNLFNIPIYVLVGNHDCINNSQDFPIIHWMQPLKTMFKNITIVDEPIFNRIGALNCIFTPYVYPGRLYSSIETFIPSSDIKNTNIIFAHQEFLGAKMGAIISDEGDDLDEFTDFNGIVISGHCHDMQLFHNDRIYYVGSALQHAFGDNDTKIIAKISSEFSSGDLPIEINTIDLKLPKRYIIKLEDNWPRRCDYEDKIKNGDLIKFYTSGNQISFKEYTKSTDYKWFIENSCKFVFKHYNVVMRPEYKVIPIFSEICATLISKHEKSADLIEEWNILKKI